MTDYSDTDLFIDGNWRPGGNGRTLAVINPATEQQIGTVACAEIADLDAAARAAAQGFDIWRATSPLDRSGLMRRAADLLRERVDEIAPLLTLEQGKPLVQSQLEIGIAADTIDWFAEEARRTFGLVIPARQPGVTQMMVKRPVGPVAAFTPWNFPVTQTVRKLAMALAAGCSIVMKAPEETPASAAALIRAFADAGLPDGVVNLVYGDPAQISEFLIPHPVIRKISFTGSVGVGMHLASLAGLHMKRATMELGGHAPVIVTADADIDDAVKTMAAHKFRNAGQVCVAPTRFLVEEAAAERFTEQFVDEVSRIKVGDGLEQGVTMGPLANARRIPALQELIDDAVDSGGTLRTGGRRIGNNGYFFEPTVLTDVPVSARIQNEEPFGPVAVINRFSTLDEAITEANRLPFGLAAYAWANTAHATTRLSEEIEAGMITINHLGLALPETPFGGIKHSGYGSEGGPQAIEAYLDTRFVTHKG